MLHSLPGSQSLWSGYKEESGSVVLVKDTGQTPYPFKAFVFSYVQGENNC